MTENDILCRYVTIVLHNTIVVRINQTIFVVYGIIDSTNLDN